MIRPPPRFTLFPYPTLFPTHRARQPPRGGLARRRIEDAADRDAHAAVAAVEPAPAAPDRKSTRLNSSHGYISYAAFCFKKKMRVPEATVVSSLECVRTAQAA